MDLLLRPQFKPGLTHLSMPLHPSLAMMCPAACKALHGAPWSPMTIWPLWLCHQPVFLARLCPTFQCCPLHHLLPRLTCLPLQSAADEGRCSKVRPLPPFPIISTSPPAIACNSIPQSLASILEATAHMQVPFQTHADMYLHNNSARPRMFSIPGCAVGFCILL